MAHPELMAWIEKQAEWAKDALRRHAVAPNFELSNEGKDEVYKRVRAEADITDGDACENVPFLADHLKGGSPEGDIALLTSLGPVKNLARIAPDQMLTFAIDGITLAYGDNGSGKSGYCRITKKVCRSASTEDLLDNVLKSGARSPAEIAIGYSLDGGKTVIAPQWVDGTPPPSPISNISVFDSRNARLFIDSENRIGFLPPEIALLEAHAKHCGEMSDKIDAEVKALNARIKVPLPAGYALDSEVSKLFQRLLPRKVLPTVEEVRALADWKNADQQELELLERTLAQDPKALADRLRRAASIFKSYTIEAGMLDTALSAEKAKALEELVVKAKLTAEAAELAAADQFKREPIKGTGTPPWRLMYDYAQEFVRSTGHGALSIKEGEPCGLCQEPLTASGALRMKRFSDFVNDAATKNADAARAALDSAAQELLDVAIVKPKDIETALADFGSLGDDKKAFSEAVVRYFADQSIRRGALVAASKSTSFEGVPAQPASMATEMSALTEALTAAALEHDKEADEGSEKRKADRARLSVLKDQKKLSSDLETILARLADLQLLAKFGKCSDLLSRRSISNQITALRRKMVTEDLEKRIRDEIKSLDLLHLPFKVTDRSDDGKSHFRVVLETPIGVANEKVLSEGEQRALALACFLGELAEDSKHGLVIDDPVSSLDHIRIRLVAERLVAEAAKGKQVIVFTHNLLFYTELFEAASKARVPIAKRIISKSDEKGFGLITNDDEPWIAKKVVDRINLLRGKQKQVAARTDYGSDGYRAAAKDFYTDLRETWERFVEEVLLNKVVERFNTDVGTQRLREVTVEDPDFEKVYWAMSRVSERCHDMAAGRNAPQPQADEMKRDLNELDEFRVAISKRKKETEARRKKLEEPPSAKTM